MKAIILAAGVGRRLGKRAEGIPKCLIPIGGRPLLLRTLASLGKLGITDRVVVVGHEREKIERLVIQDSTGIGRVRFRVNPDYKKGSILSLWCVRDEFESEDQSALGGLPVRARGVGSTCLPAGRSEDQRLVSPHGPSQMNDDLLIMDADVLFPDALLSKLVSSPHANAFLLDPRSDSSGEEMMLMVKGDRVIHIGRKMEGAYDLIGEGVGFLKLSHRDAPLLKEVLEQLVREGKDGCEYEEALEVFLQKAVVGYEPVGTLAWTEIDFPEDIEKAEKEVLPLLNVQDI